MAKSPRRNDADYIRFPPNYVFKANAKQSARNDLWRLGLGILALMGLAAVIIVAGFFILRATFAQMHANGAPVMPRVGSHMEGWQFAGAPLAADYIYV